MLHHPLQLTEGVHQNRGDSALCGYLFTAVLRNARLSCLYLYVSTAVMTNVHMSLQLLHRLPQDGLEF